MDSVKMGFPPVYDERSRVLILGSFPSVKSREISFYYGNKQNRFWKMICAFFKETIPETVDGKRDFLLRNKIALWDMATACEIEGSADASIKNAQIADLNEIFKSAKIEKILLNGTLAYDLFIQKYAATTIPFVKMPSTSPANPRFDENIWHKELYEIF
ncbi:MAG: DNA-deoxyinosine glycosylase [Clostridia bacterium]|nr:DNA-deoxyinosine glycosylase [Clostridia bacterium]